MGRVSCFISPVTKHDNWSALLTCPGLTKQRRKSQYLLHSWVFISSCTTSQLAINWRECYQKVTDFKATQAFHLTLHFLTLSAEWDNDAKVSSQTLDIPPTTANVHTAWIETAWNFEHDTNSAVSPSVFITTHFGELVHIVLCIKHPKPPYDVVTHTSQRKTYSGWFTTKKKHSAAHGTLGEITQSRGEAARSEPDVRSFDRPAARCASLHLTWSSRCQRLLYTTSNLGPHMCVKVKNLGHPIPTLWTARRKHEITLPSHEVREVLSSTQNIQCVWSCVLPHLAKEAFSDQLQNNNLMTKRNVRTDLNRCKFARTKHSKVVEKNICLASPALQLDECICRWDSSFKTSCDTRLFFTTQPSWHMAIVKGSTYVAISSHSRSGVLYPQHTDTLGASSLICAL